MNQESPNKIKPKVGMYAVHRKYNPGNLDIYDHTYKISGYIWNTETDQLDFLYLPLYAIQDEIIQSLGKSFKGFTRNQISFQNPYDIETGEPRFRFFTTKKKLEQFLEQARQLFAQGSYKWYTSN